MTTHSDLQSAIQWLKAELTAAQLFHVCEQDEDNPNIFTLAAHDDNDHINTGIAAWSDEDQQLHFICHNPGTARHDELEGVPEDESKQWWEAKTRENMLLHLTGEVREIVGRFRQIALDSGQ